MEVMSPAPPQEFLLDSAASAAYTPKPAIMNPFACTDDVAVGNPFLATAGTAPSSPNPFEQLPPGASDAGPFDLFEHFTSAPTSPARAAAIYAQFDTVNGGAIGNDDDNDDDVGFQPRVSYSMSKPAVVTTVPFDWEEKPGKPKAEFASVSATVVVEAGETDGADFDFGVLLDKAAQAEELTTADELFNDGKIRPLKPPPRLLEGGSVGSSPRSARSVMWSPRLRGLAGHGSANNANFDPFAAALAKAANAPSPLGAGTKHDAGGVGAAASPPSSPPVTGNGGGRKKWRLRDLLLFRKAAKGRTTAAGSVSKDPVFKYAPVQQRGVPEKAAIAGPVAAEGDASSGKHKKQSKKAAPAEGGMAMPMPMPQRQNLMMGCVRLHPGLHRLAKGFHGHAAPPGRRHE